MLPAADVVLALTAAVYFRGWAHLRRALPGVVPVRRLAAFLSGLAVVWIASCSPLAMLDADLLTIHMVQHLLLMLAAAPLILGGAPALPFLHGAPHVLTGGGLGKLLRRAPLQALGHLLTHPATCWLAATLVVMGWHFPAPFELALKSEAWHGVEHASFFAAGILFWWPVIQPWPSVPRWPRWSIPLYLFFATLPCDALSAFLAFSGHVIYTPYLSAPRLLNMSALQDQEAAGALMWVCVTFAYMVPAIGVTIRILSPPANDPLVPRESVRSR